MSQKEKNVTDGESKLKKNISRLLLLTVCGSVIYGLPYFRWSFYDSFIELYQLSNEQLGMLGSAYGFFGLISYLLGGVLADRVSAKKLIYLSLMATGIGGLIHYFTTSYNVLVVLYAVWGLTSLLTFWPALIKVVRLTGGSSEQSRVFGIFEGGRGIVNTINGTAVVAIFGAISAGATAGAGLKSVILYYSIITIALGILCIFLIKDEKSEDKTATKFQWNIVQQALKHPAVWMVSIILCCTYTMNMSYNYFNPYSTSVFGATAVVAALLTTLAQYVRPIASPAAGFMADKLGRPNMMLVGFTAMAIATAAILLLPESSSVIILCIMCAIVYIAMYMNYGVVMSLMDEGGIPLEISGTAIGIVCTVGYLPEVICPLLAGKVLDANEGIAGYQIYFGGVIVMMLLGIAAILVWKKIFIKQKEPSKAEAVEN